MKELFMSTKVIVTTLAFAIIGGTLAPAQDSKPQATNSANAHVMNLDRCPYYPSPVFCRDASRAHEQDQWGHNADDR
jgi:hypothetical protein